jgi:hypothetical protein
MFFNASGNSHSGKRKGGVKDEPSIIHILPPKKEKKKNFVKTSFFSREFITSEYSG